MSKTRVTITVDGGVVQDVSSNDPDVQVTLIDWDNIRDGHEPIENYGVNGITDQELVEDFQSAMEEALDRQNY